MKHLYLYEINNSQFYGYIFELTNVNEFEIILETLKKQHKRATHFVYVYKIYDNNQCIFKRNDDIEPRGYATNGMINLIEKNNLNNIAFIIVRYFGGRKLGGSKLINSYNKTVNESYKKYINNK